MRGALELSLIHISFGTCRIAQAGLLTNDIVQLFTLAYRGSKVIGLHTEAQLWLKSPARMNEVVTLEGAYTDAYQKRGQAVSYTHLRLHR